MKKRLITLLAASSLLGGCAQTVDYVNSQIPNIPSVLPELPSIHVGGNELDKTATAMTNKMLSSPAVSAMTSGRNEPVLFVNTLQNKTRQHLDTEQLTSTIKKRVSRSGKFDFANNDRVNAARQQMNLQSNDRLVNQNTAMQFANKVGAHYMLYGNVSDTTKTQGGKRVPFYKMTMRLMDIKSGTIEWSDIGLLPKPTSAQGW